MKELKLKQKTNMKYYVPAFDGVPGVMPGIMTLRFLPDFAEEEIESAQPQDRKKYHPRNLNNIPRHKRRMMPCDRVEKKKSE